MTTQAMKSAKQVLLPTIKWSMLLTKKQMKKWLLKPNLKPPRVKVKVMTWV